MASHQSSITIAASYPRTRMSRRTFFISCVFIASIAFLRFRSITGPNPLNYSPLQLFLAVGFALSGFLAAYLFTIACPSLRLRSLRFAAIPVLLVGFIALSGVSVFTATALSAALLRVRGYDLETQHHQYGDSSGMQMITFDAGLWIHVVYAAIPSLLLLAVVFAGAVLTGINADKHQFKALETIA